MAKGFNVITYGAVVSIGSILYNDVAYLITAIYNPITTTFIKNMNIVAIMTNSIHGIIQILVPTSVFLVMGLKYFDVSYSKWLKNIYKFVLYTLLLFIIVIIIMVLI